jgi:hypothetical protein
MVAGREVPRQHGDLHETDRFSDAFLQAMSGMRWQAIFTFATFEAT